MMMNLATLAEPLLETSKQQLSTPRHHHAVMMATAACSFMGIALLGLAFIANDAHPILAGSTSSSPLVAIWQSSTAGARSPLVELWESSAAGARLERVDHLSRDVARDPNVILRIDPSTELQTIEGFGAAITQASGIVWGRLKSERLRQSVVESYFGESGIRASLARVPINSCDFAEASYSFDETAGDLT